MTGLYIHIPLCVARCRYCDFYKETLKEWNDVELFIQCLEIELGRLPDDFAPDTVFIGGGTPTALEPDQYSNMLEVLGRTVNLSNVVEFTSEANPGTLTSDKLATMTAGGVNRVSIGVQSFNDTALKSLGRIHSATEAIESFHKLREAGFENINIDLIQSIPEMSPKDILTDVQKALELAPEHISYYNLIYESGTPMTRDLHAGRIIPPDEDEEADNYYAVKTLLEKAGYNHYEISNFSRNQKPCLHNILYWQGGEYYGCGPSAHSHWNGKRFGNVSDLQKWCNRLQRGEKPFEQIEKLLPEEKARETLVMWLRMIEGVDLKLFKQQHGVDVHELCGKDIELLVEESLLEHTETRLALSPDALFVCNSVFSELV